MVNASIKAKLDAWFPDGVLDKQWTDHVLANTARDLRSRSWGNYEGCHESNLNVITENIHGVLSKTPGAVKRWKQEQWPQVSRTTFQFNSLAHFKTYQLPFVQVYPDHPCKITLGATEHFIGSSERFYNEGTAATHEGCQYIGRYRRGCDLCEMLYLLSAHPKRKRNEIAQGVSFKQMEVDQESRDAGCSALKEAAGPLVTFTKAINGGEFEVTVRCSAGESRALTVEGSLGRLDWSLLDSKSAVEREIAVETPVANVQPALPSPTFAAEEDLIAL